MLQGVVYSKELAFKTALMDTWYASQKVMKAIDNLGKIYYCPLKKNRLVDDAQGQEYYKSVESLSWTPCELESGKVIKIKTFSKFKKVKLFRVIVSTNKTEYLATSDLTQSDTNDVQKVYAIRWKIEEFHARNQAINRNRVLSVSESSDSKKSHCLRFTCMGKA